VRGPWFPRCRTVANCWSWAKASMSWLPSPGPSWRPFRNVPEASSVRRLEGPQRGPAVTARREGAVRTWEKGRGDRFALAERNPSRSESVCPTQPAPSRPRQPRSTTRRLVGVAPLPSIPSPAPIGGQRADPATKAPAGDVELVARTCPLIRQRRHQPWCSPRVSPGYTAAP